MTPYERFERIVEWLTLALMVVLTVALIVVIVVGTVVMVRWLVGV